MKILLKKIERTVGGLKFAVTIILIFTFFMIIGTFLESYYGTDFANRTIYKKFPFMLVQFAMFLSILFATFLRLPFKPRLTGFYLIHTGLILIGCGSFITWYAGIDGHISLMPNQATRQVILNEDVLTLHFKDEKGVTQKKHFDLPYTAFKSNIDKELGPFHFTTYLPYSDSVLSWKEEKENNDKSLQPYTHSSRYLIANANISQDFTLSLHPRAQEFQSTLDMGPLSINYLPTGMASCFALNNPSKLILYNSRSGECFTPEQRKIAIKKTSSGKRFLVVRHNGEFLSYFPEISPWPLSDDLKSIRRSDLRLFNKELFESSPHLFAFGQSIAFYSKEDKKWQAHTFKSANDSLELPWMGFELTLIRHEESKYPIFIPVYTYPIQKNGELIRGGQKALEVNIGPNKYWLTDARPLTLEYAGQTLTMVLEKKSLSLPFEFTLEKFNMDKDPGTNNPASYESFVRVFDQEGSQTHHIYMNNPLKYKGFTFYQASYSQLPDGRYGSTLSANVDQGRFLKYFGSLLLVFGAIVHYLLNKARWKKKKVNHHTEMVGVQV